VRPCRILPSAFAGRSLSRGEPLSPAAAYEAAYFAMAVAFYGPVAYWQVKRDDSGPAR
jgi:hypothetical protein